MDSIDGIDEYNGLHKKSSLKIFCVYIRSKQYWRRVYKQGYKVIIIRH